MTEAEEELKKTIQPYLETIGAPAFWFAMFQALAANRFETGFSYLRLNTIDHAFPYQRSDQLVKQTDD